MNDIERTIEIQEKQLVELMHIRDRFKKMGVCKKSMDWINERIENQEYNLVLFTNKVAADREKELLTLD